jgi:hypothetical protein
MSIKYSIDFSSFTPEEFHAWNKAMVEAANKKNNTNFKVLEQDLSNASGGFSNIINEENLPTQNGNTDEI